MIVQDFSKSVEIQSILNKLTTFKYENEQIQTIWSKIFSKNICELRITTPIDNEKLAALIVNSLNIDSIDENRKLSKLRDLELSLQSAGDIKSILEALSNNYMIKTLRLTNTSKENVDEYTENLAKKFKRSRVGTEVIISSSNKSFRSSKINSIEVFYPDAF